MGKEIASAPTPVGSLMEPDFANQEATRYRTNLDENFTGHQRLAGPFAPQEGGPRYAFDPGDVDTGTDKITWTDFPLDDQATVKLENDQATADPPAPAVVGTTYYIEAPGADDFQLEASIGGGALDFTDGGSGKHILVPQPLMKVWVGPGWLFDGATRTEVAGQFTAAITAPVTNPRIDLVHIDASTGAVGVTAGSEAATPSAPALPAGKLPVALVTLATDTTEITNSIITDVRCLWDYRTESGGTLADSDATLVVSPGKRYVVSGWNGTHIKTLDSSGMRQGQRISFYNADSTYSCVLKADDAGSWYTLAPGEHVELEALASPPTDGTEWGKVHGSEKLRVFTELTQEFTADAGADTISLGTNDGLADAGEGQYDKAFYASSTTTLPAGLAASTPYYIRDVTATTCKLALTPGGAAIDITDAGTGTHTLTPQWLAPLGVARAWASATGGGGGGGSGARDNAENIANGGGGAGAGGTAEGFKAFVPGTAYAVAIGAKGVGGAAPADGVDGADGTNGEDSTFNGLAGNGGVRGRGAVQTAASTLAAGGAGGPSSGGDLNFTGGDGAPAVGPSVASNAQGVGGVGGQSRVPRYGNGGPGGRAIENSAAFLGGNGDPGVVVCVY